MIYLTPQQVAAFERYLKSHSCMVFASWLRTLEDVTLSTKHVGDIVMPIV